MLCSAVFSACGLYRSHRLSHWKQRLYEIFLAVTLITGAFLVLKQLIHPRIRHQCIPPVVLAPTFCSLVLSHEIALRLLHLARLRGRNLRNVIIVGEGPDAAALADRVSQETSLGYRVLRIIDAREMAEDGWIAGDS